MATPKNTNSFFYLKKKTKKQKKQRKPTDFKGNKKIWKKTHKINERGKTKNKGA